MSVFSSEILKRKLRHPVSGLFLLMAPFAGCASPSNGPVLLHSSNPCGKRLPPESGSLVHHRPSSFLAGALLQLKSSFTFPSLEMYDLPLALPPHFLQDADSCLYCLPQSACPPKNPTHLLDTLLWPRLVQGFRPLLSPWSLCHSQLLPPGSICYFSSSSQPSYPVSAPRCTCQNSCFQLFPLRGWEEKATLGMPSWSGDFSTLLYQGISTCRMGISHRPPVKRALKCPGSWDTACLALIKW